MIPVFRFLDRSFNKPLTPEYRLAEEMGRPPWGDLSLPRSASCGDLLDRTKAPLVGLVFDPEFHYAPQCWERWAKALVEEGCAERINVPLGNQDPAWREGLDVPIYLTLRGLEETARFKGPARWVLKRTRLPEAFILAVVPRSVLSAMPASWKLGRLPEHWARNAEEVRIFCEGWLHSFNAIKQVGLRPELISMCDWHGNVLELGCGSGLMAKACKARYPDLQWTGIDRDHQALKQAAIHLDRVIQADIDMPLPLKGGLKFDWIVCGDVLEHLPYPWELLSRLTQWINPEGFLIAAFPNVGHWSVIEDLLGGRWDETPAGLFCISHLRFGTRYSWARWFEKAGWEVIRWEREMVRLPERSLLQALVPNTFVDRESLETVRYRVLARIDRSQCQVSYGDPGSVR